MSRQTELTCIHWSQSQEHIALSLVLIAYSKKVPSSLNQWGSDSIKLSVYPHSNSKDKSQLSVIVHVAILVQNAKKKKSVIAHS